MAGDVDELEPAITLLGAALAQGEKARQTSIGGAVGRVAEQARTVDEVEAGTDDDAEIHVPGRAVGADDAGERVAVGDGKGAQAQLPRLRHQLFGMGRAAQEGEVGRDLELGIGGHSSAFRPEARA